PEEPEPQGHIEYRKWVSARGDPERDHLTYDFIDHNALSIVSPQMLDARRRPDADDEEKNYSMQIISAGAAPLHQKIDDDADSRTGGARRFRHETRAQSRRDGDRKPVGDADRLSLRLHDFHLNCEFLRAVFRSWERDNHHRPICRDRSACSAHCRTGSTHFPRVRFPFCRSGISHNLSNKVVFKTFRDLHTVEVAGRNVGVARI